MLINEVFLFIKPSTSVLSFGRETKETTLKSVFSFSTLNHYNPHFDDPETAQLFADNYFDRLKFDSTIRTLDTSGFELRMKNKNSLPNRVKDITGVKQRGFDYECYMSACYAESLGLRNVLVQDKNGSWHAINQNGALPDIDEDKMKNLISNARVSLEGAYDIANETNSEKFCRAIYYRMEILNY